MKIATLLTVASCAVAMTVAAPALKAGDSTTADGSSYMSSKPVISQNSSSSSGFFGSVTAGWDSLYMRNGQNMLGTSPGSVWVQQK